MDEEILEKFNYQIAELSDRCLRLANANNHLTSVLDALYQALYTQKVNGCKFDEDGSVGEMISEIPFTR